MRQSVPNRIDKSRNKKWGGCFDWVSEKLLKGAPSERIAKKGKSVWLILELVGAYLGSRSSLN